MTRGRKKKAEASQPNVEHRVFGPGELLFKRLSQGGEPVLVVRFANGVERTLLADPRFWTTPVSSLAEVPVQPPIAEPEPPEKADSDEVYEDVQPRAEDEEFSEEMHVGNDD